MFRTVCKGIECESLREWREKMRGKTTAPPRRAYPTTNANVQEIEGDFYLYQFLKQFTG